MTPLTPEDILTYIYKIQLNFDNSYQTSSTNERKLLITSWYEILCEYPKEICDKAVTNTLRRASFAPRIGDIVNEIENILNADSKSDEELWAELMGVTAKVYDISRYLKYEQYFKNASAKLRKIYDSLSEALKLYVVNISTLIEISELPQESLPFEKTRFFKQMPILRKHAEEKIAAMKFFDDINSVKKIPDKK